MSAGIARKSKEQNCDGKGAGESRDDPALAITSQSTSILDNWPILRWKLVIVGDGATGKTALGVFLHGVMPTEFSGGAFNNYIGDVEVDGKHVEFALWDTAGQEDYDKLRAFTYLDTDVVLVCFAIDSPDSLDNVLEKWVSEVLDFCPKVPIILIRMKKDLRAESKTYIELRKTFQKPVPYNETIQVRENIGASIYLKCSTLYNEGVQALFEHVARLALLPKKNKKERKKKKPGEGSTGSFRRFFSGSSS